ncbi:protein phosphatase 1 regulatory subunit 36-like [Drosophila bipectinata]|uniref:protein phosphatase 1 regulatory subunit 36-like n=1 Tax=Drosophila bipectinata TaxID=42026 RepID=UPI001C8ADF5B|nr:protein phosphatase 1 regulatory subunit 36-like [Drosophila bipectinata]
MKRVHVDNYTPKYYSGKWSWDANKDRLHFEPHSDLEDARERYIITNGYKFLRTINQEEELIFRQAYVRDDSTYDCDTVVINDIRDLVLFLMPSEFLTHRFVEFMHRPAVHRLIHALIIYFEYFLRLVEFVLIRRDELAGQIQSQQTIEMKKTFSIYLSQYRILVARNYSVILKGEGDMAEYYHLKEIVNISDTDRDKIFHEQFLAVTTQMVWICMHRRAYNVIEMEMNRLFRSDHFIMTRPEYLRFTRAERSLLYGGNNKIVNYRTQVSPLIQELEHVPDADMPILWIGERKYRGTDLRIAEMELEYIVPGPQLRMIDIAHGILGHPKRLYNTILDLDWPTVRYSNFSIQYDPYHIVRQPHLDIPKIDAGKMRKMNEHYEHFYKVYRIYEPHSIQILKKWLKRDKLIQFYRSGGLLLTNIFSRCETELSNSTSSPKIDQIISSYFKVKSRLRKGSPYAEDNVSITTSRIGGVSSPRQKRNPTDYFFD